MTTRTPPSAEHARLAEARERGIPWRQWGPYLSERQWGTVREDYSDDGDAWDYFTPRPGALARLSLGRGRDRRRLRRPAAAVLRARALERPRPDPQGAPVRPDEQRGQPRRGRQGVLLLPRLDADALVHEVALQVPAGGLPVRRSRRRRTARRGRHELEYELLDTGVFDDDRYFDVVRRVREGVPERPAHRDHASQPRARSRRRSTCCRRSGSATPGHGAATIRGRSSARPASTGRTSIARRTPDLGELPPDLPTAPPRCSSPRTRPNTERLSGAPNRTPYVKDGIDAYLVHGAARRRESGSGSAPRPPPTTR